ncbi:transporter substrate-binding domain-containing protein [Lentilactobacillus laojiaonis]|uniref:transporter substrate-binding domain-containing protein n=1 Tax=Lentilactobacillus laojiaonis TaxID=2883998 RepID=UPI001D09F148|nr:transporter substrate-binding domain-containing protein [Lentilactobacillus laojiaonis]UDM32195.1 transporter substrate-binding domain-containing protein [Lentilactobacillus laojiaonis]
MKNKYKKLGALVLTGLVGLLVITGCGKNNNSKNESLDSELKTSKTLTIGLEGTYAPYSYRQNGQLNGFEVELGKDLAKEMNLKADIVPTKWDSLIAGLSARKFDIVLNNVTMTHDREKQFLFSKPYIYSKTVLIVPKDSSIKSLKDIKGKTFANSMGTEFGSYAKQYGAKVIPSDNFQNTVSLLEEGRAQGTLNSKEAFASWQKDNKANTKLKAIDIPASQIPTLKVGAIFNKKSTKLQSDTNKALDKLAKDGTLSKLSEKYFGTDITKK